MMRQLIYDGERKADIYVADTFLTRFLGYMGRKQPQHEAILIKPCSSIHTYLMKFDIDVLFLNKDMKIIKKIEKLGHNKVIMPVKGAAMVIEAKAGMFKSFVVGSKITIQ